MRKMKITLAVLVSVSSLAFAQKSADDVLGNLKNDKVQVIIITKRTTGFIGVSEEKNHGSEVSKIGDSKWKAEIKKLIV